MMDQRMDILKFSYRLEPHTYQDIDPEVQKIEENAE